MDHIKKAVPGLVEKFNARGNETYEKMVPIILKKGVDNVNLAMFSDEMRGNVLNAVAEKLLKKGKNPGSNKHIHKDRQQAEAC